ncbi:hypothetical protein BGX34_011909 [Mortierella sp. NVP85]|nr:hypothetical protein BGX34_011909 [Mortierella sp. NVP85]
MKFSLFNSFAILVCAFTVVGRTQVEAKKDSPGHPRQAPGQCIADPGMEIFCDPSRKQLDQIFDDVFAKITYKTLNAHQKPGMTSAERRRMNAIALAKTQGLFTDIKDYFVTYWDNLKLIFQGHFGEGIFRQLKNAGSWCEKDNWIVKAIKAGINVLSGGALSSICDCVYPMIKSYDNYHQLVADIEARGLVEILGKCTDSLRKHIKDALKKSGSIVKNEKSSKERS